MTSTCPKIKQWLGIKEDKLAVILMMKMIQKLLPRESGGKEKGARNGSRRTIAISTSSFSIVGSLGLDKRVNKLKKARQSTCLMESHLNLRYRLHLKNQSSRNHYIKV